MDPAANQHKVLVVEDEPLVAMMVEDMLSSLGFGDAVLASRLDDALTLAKTGEFDIAVLDVHINGDYVFPVADVLAERDIPFMFATGRGEKDIPPRYRDRPLITKPYPAERLVDALYRLESKKAVHH